MTNKYDSNNSLYAMAMEAEARVARRLKIYEEAQAKANIAEGLLISARITLRGLNYQLDQEYLNDSGHT